MSGRSVRGGIVVTGYAEPGYSDVEMRDGFVVAEPDEPADVLDARGRFVLPGLVNAHDHLRSMLPSTRRGEGSSLTEIVDAGQRAAEAATADDYRALTALASARLLLSGVTEAVDHVYPLDRPGLLGAVVAGHKDVGLRGQVAYGLLGDAVDAQLARAVTAADDELPAERLYLGPVSLRQTPLDGYRAAVATADDTGLRLYTHIAESRDEVEKCVADHGVRPVELLHRIGFLRPGTVLVHCVHLTEHEIELLAESGATVAYCPSNHLKLAKGFAPVTALRDAGVPVVLGVDGMTDLFTEMRQAVYAQASAAGRTGALDPSSALRMAAPDGRLVPGSRADLVTVRADRLGLHPLADPVQAVVHRCTGPDVVDVLVDGEPVVTAGRLVRAEETELMQRAWEATRDLARRTGRDVPADWAYPPTELSRPAPAPGGEHTTPSREGDKDVEGSRVPR